MKKFIPQNHKEIEQIALWAMILLSFLLLIFLWFSWEAFLLGLLIASPLYYMEALILIRKCGLYIENDTLIFKRFLRKKIDINDVAGLLIIKSERHSRYGHIYLTNRDKSYKYSIIYLKDVNPDFAKFNLGDISFMTIYKEDAYFHTVYDEDIIELFKGKIPIIVCK